MFLNDKLIFNKSFMYFSSDISDISDCWKDCIENDDTLLKLECYLKPMSPKYSDNNLEYNTAETIFKGYVTNDLKFREKIKPFSIGIGTINNQNLKLQLLPSNESPNSNIVNPIIGTRIMVRVLQELLMIDL